jgi:nitrate reductase NapAB chaperone NapD
MRSTLHGPEVYLLKSKKPRIVALIAAAKEMSIEDIEKLEEKPDIIAGLLKLKKIETDGDSMLLAERLADLMTAKHHPNLK